MVQGLRTDQEGEEGEKMILGLLIGFVIGELVGVLTSAVLIASGKDETYND